MLNPGYFTNALRNIRLATFQEVMLKKGLKLIVWIAITEFVKLPRVKMPDRTFKAQEINVL